MIVLRLPIPPSINAAYANQRKGYKGRGRYKTAVYKAWELEADAWLIEEGYYKGWRGVPSFDRKIALEIKLPKIRGDASNRIKVLEDWLVSREITGDDRHNHKVSVEIDETLDCCEVRISQIGVDT